MAWAMRDGAVPRRGSRNGQPDRAGPDGGLARYYLVLPRCNPDVVMGAKVNMAVKLEPGLNRKQPELGRVVEGEDFRDLTAPFGGGAYVLRYRIDEDAVVVARGGVRR